MPSEVAEFDETLVKKLLVCPKIKNKPHRLYLKIEAVRFITLLS